MNALFVLGRRDACRCAVQHCLAVAKDALGPEDFRALENGLRHFAETVLSDR